jgi:OTU domain-containing protein 7
LIVDVDPVLHRALSTVAANQTLVHNQRNVLAKNYRRTSFNDEIVTINHNDADASFLLPNLNEIPENIRIRVMDNLVDTPTMNALEETSILLNRNSFVFQFDCFLERLNWWVDKKLPCPKLYPLVTSGDGNCLLHATSLGKTNLLKR